MTEEDGTELFQGIKMTTDELRKLLDGGSKNLLGEQKEWVEKLIAELEQISNAGVACDYVPAFTNFLMEMVADSRPRPISLPAAKVFIDSSPMRQVVRQQSPGAACTKGVLNGIDNLSHRVSVMLPAWFLRWKKQRKYLPLSICKDQSNKPADMSVWVVLLE